MSRKFDFVKWFGRSIGFLIIFSPMITTLVSMDRMAIERAVKSENINECESIKRSYFATICQEKIVRRKTEYCKKKPSPKCHEIFIQPVSEKKMQGSPFWLLPIEIVVSLLITLWAMGLTPNSILRKLPHALANISASEIFALYRIPVALVFFFVCYYLFQLAHELYLEV